MMDRHSAKFSSLGFRPNYACEVVEPFDIPQEGRIEFRHENQSMAGWLLYARITPQGADAWHGVFAPSVLGGGISGVFDHPDPWQLLAVSGGAGYVVDVRPPYRCSIIPLEPIYHVVGSQRQSTLVVASSASVVAYGCDKEIWRDDELRIDLDLNETNAVHVRDDEVRCSGYDYVKGKRVRVCIDLASGVTKRRDYIE